MRFLDRVILCWILLLSTILFLWYVSKPRTSSNPSSSSLPSSHNPPLLVPKTPPQEDFSIQSCTDNVWCNVQMPAVSFFRFPPPDDMRKWNIARSKAASGEQVLLKKIISYFPNYMDFLDGDILFRQYNLPADYYIDRNHDFRALVSSSGKIGKPPKHVEYEWEKTHKSAVLPPQYNFRATNRAPVVKMGYFAFSREGSRESVSPYFMGRKVGEAVVERNLMLNLWRQQKHNIDTPFIALHAANENWGMLSTLFPNRTTNWGSCCSESSIDREELLDFLNHDKLLLLLVNQHHNITHPKVVTAPRGLPLTFPNNAKIVWDSMRSIVHMKKSQFVFLSSSKWGYRPKIIECLNRKFSPSDFQSASYSSNLQGRLTQEDYYVRMGTSRFGIALPGLGYDTFRLWELLTIGSIPIIEKGVGLDKSLWRLPALLVEDFDELTPELLRTAYVEALYRADEFEFERLKQSWWWSFIMNVSTARSVQAVLDKFPLESEDAGFTRPRERFDCSRGCGSGTKRTPKSYC